MTYYNTTLTGSTQMRYDRLPTWRRYVKARYSKIISHQNVLPKIQSEADLHSFIQVTALKYKSIFV